LDEPLVQDNWFGCATYPQPQEICARARRGDGPGTVNVGNPI